MFKQNRNSTLKHPSYLKGNTTVSTNATQQKIRFTAALMTRPVEESIKMM